MRQRTLKAPHERSMPSFPSDMPGSTAEMDVVVKACVANTWDSFSLIGIMMFV